MVTDSVGDFIIRLKNATDAGHTHVAMPHSKLRAAIADKLKDAGFIKGYEKRGRKVRKVLDVELLDPKGDASIRGVERISKPGRRLYVRVSDIRPVRSGYGALLLSTPKGILTDKEARKENVGGEALFKIW